ncbi:MAG: alpha-E domain-containing protein, partial [Acidimicrobiales bacterium]
DQEFPRSAWHALAAAENALAEIEAWPAGRGSDEEARRILGRARASLEYRRRGQPWDDLPVVLAGLQRDCAEANLAVAERFFHQGRSLSWTAESAGVAAG